MLHTAFTDAVAAGEEQLFFWERSCVRIGPAAMHGAKRYALRARRRKLDCETEVAKLLRNKAAKNKAASLV
jgi:hypothetical protein